MVSWTGHSPLCGAGEKSHKEYGSLLLLTMVCNRVVSLRVGPSYTGRELMVVLSITYNVCNCLVNAPVACDRDSLVTEPLW